MITIKNILKPEEKFEKLEKTAAAKRKIRIKSAFFGSLALLLILFSPFGVQTVASFCKLSYKNNFSKVIFQKATDILWVYGYYEETLLNYHYIYKNTFERLNLALAQESFHNIAMTHYKLKNFRTARYYYRIFKARWPKADKKMLKQINKDLKLISKMKPSCLTIERACFDNGWIIELGYKYGCSF